jgi:hypothetical protein
MAKKPTPGLPDVFARPGDAPARGTPIEDLPANANDATAPQYPGNDTAAYPPATEPSSANPGPMSAEPGGAAATTSASPLPPHAPLPPGSAARTGESSGSGWIRGIPAVVWIILIVSVTAPLWGGFVRSGLGIHTPTDRTVARSVTSLARQDARLGVLEQRVGATTTQLDALRTELAAANQRAAKAAAEAHALALMRLADLLHSSEPFGPELSVVRAARGDGPTLQAILVELGPYAANGAPMPDQLLRELQSLHSGLVRVVRRANPGTWMDLVRWTGLYYGTQPPKPADPSVHAVDLALGSLTSGDIGGAIEQLSQVDTIYQANFADWIAEAKARVLADAAIQQIDIMIARASGTQ